MEGKGSCVLGWRGVQGERGRVGKYKVGGAWQGWIGRVGESLVQEGCRAGWEGWVHLRLEGRCRAGWEA